MLTLMPSEISLRIAGTPSGVAGTLIIRLARPTSRQRARGLGQCRNRI